MENNSSSDLLGSLTLFFIFTLIASTTLLIALILWLAELLSSLILALVVVGVATTLLSLLIYFTVVKPTMRSIRDEISLIYQVAKAAHIGYSWVTKVVGTILS